MSLIRLFLLALSGLSTLGTLASAAEYDAPPMTRTVDQIDEFHGVPVADPYRWLEDDVRVSQDVADWVERQNAHTFSWLEQIPERDSIKARMTELYDFEKYGAPFKAGGRYYFLKNEGLQNQYVLYVQDSLDAEARVLIDPNAWSADGTWRCRSVVQR